MRRRLLAAVAALVLALVGAVVLLAYVKGADARALAGSAPCRCSSSTRPIASGTAGGRRSATWCSTEQLPARRGRPPGRVTDLAALAGQVATVDLQPGEQLLAVPLRRPAELQAPGTVAVPAGLQEVSVLLEPQRAVGGRLAAGDTVGVFVSLVGPRQRQHPQRAAQGAGHPGAGRTAPPAAGNATAAQTGRRSGAAAPTQTCWSPSRSAPPRREAVVFGAEHGKLWLSLEPKAPTPAAPR